MNIADLNTLARFLSDSDSTSYSAANLLITINQAYEEVIAKILNADGRWQWDDSNRTDFPIATTTLVNSQPDYTFDVAQLKVLGVSVLDNLGNFYPLVPIDFEDIKFSGVDPSEYYETDGRPAYYDKQGSSLVLHPAPDNGVSVTLAAGLKVFFQRTADLFTSAQVTTGTKVPGFASPFHMILAYKAAIPYCIKYKPERVASLEFKAQQMEADMIRFYTKREKDERNILAMKPAPDFA